MTDPKTVTVQERLVDWCQSCRDTRLMVHCSDPGRCGGMQRIPYAEAERRYLALKAADATLTQLNGGRNVG